MKSLKFLFFSFLSCCITETDNHLLEYRFEITNNSGFDINIQGFNRGNNDIKTGTYILNSATYSKSFFSSSRGRGFFYSDVLGGDSIKIVFDNTKFKIFKCYRSREDKGCNDERNILSTFQDLNEDDKIILNRFTFEPIDYQNAEDCNGNCE